MRKQHTQLLSETTEAACAQKPAIGSAAVSRLKLLRSKKTRLVESLPTEHPPFGTASNSRVTKQPAEQPAKKTATHSWHNSDEQRNTRSRECVCQRRPAARKKLSRVLVTHSKL